MLRLIRIDPVELKLARDRSTPEAKV